MLDERARMAREIHDTIAHGLTGIVTQLEAAEQASDRPDDWRAPRRQRRSGWRARACPRRAGRSRRRGRRSWRARRSRTALADVAERWSAINGVPVEFMTTGDPMPLHPEIEVALLRTAQEALANVAKHAGASRAGLTLSYMGDVVALDVRDDGVGFEVPDRVGRTAVRLRPDGDAPAGRPRRGHARDRVRARRRDRDLGARARRSASRRRATARDRRSGS